MVERRMELDRRYHRTKKMRKLKSKLQTAQGRGSRKNSLQDKDAQPILDGACPGSEEVTRLENDKVTR